MKLETASRAAHWWADKLRNPENPNRGAVDAPETDVLDLILQVLELSKSKDDDATRFELSLMKILQDIDREWVMISVDYYPDDILCDAADVAGVNLGVTRLPLKTSMNIRGDEISVADGCGANWVKI